jgi:hypothetical protein
MIQNKLGILMMSRIMSILTFFAKKTIDEKDTVFIWFSRDVIIDMYDFIPTKIERMSFKRVEKVELTTGGNSYYSLDCVFDN